MLRMIEDRDIPRCLDIYNWYILNSTVTFETVALSLDEFTERVHRVRNKYPWIVLEDEGTILGYAYFDAFNSRAAYDWSADVSVYLDHEAKGKGYGTILMNELFRYAKANGYRKLISLITIGNTASEHIHEKLGFHKNAVLPDTGYKNGSWLGVTFYVKDVEGFDSENFTSIRNINLYE